MPPQLRQKKNINSQRKDILSKIGAHLKVGIEFNYLIWLSIILIIVNLVSLIRNLFSCVRLFFY